MFTVQSKANTLRVYFEEKLIFRHSKEQPFIVVKSADGKVGKLSAAVYEEGKSTIRFSGAGITMSLHMIERDGSLFLVPQRQSAGIRQTRFFFPAPADPVMFGGGAQEQSLNLQGRRVVMRIGEKRSAASDMGQAGLIHARNTRQFCQPTLFTREPMYIHADTPEQCVFDLRGRHTIVLEVDGVPKSLSVAADTGCAEVIGRIKKNLGTQPRLPDWCAGGLWIDGRGGQSEVLQRVDRALGAGVKLAAVMIMDWTGRREYKGKYHDFWDWTVNQEIYPDMQGLIRELNARGVRAMACITPHLAIEGRLFSEASFHDYLIKKPEGGVYLSDMGGFMAGHIDLTSAGARNWYKDVIKNNILRLGFSGYLAGMGTFLPDDAVLAGGMPAGEVHNIWPTIWATLNRTAANEMGGKEEPVVLLRTGFTGATDCSPAIWTGRHTMTWGQQGGFKSALIAALSLGFSGIDVAHAEIGGSLPFLGAGRSRELMLRWAEYAAFTPVMRITDGINAKSCAQFDTDYETYEYFVKLSGLHKLLCPYMTAAAAQARAGGLPVMRAMFMQYPNEHLLTRTDDQYMLGDDLLVAPVMKKGAAERSVILPYGQWIHIWTGREYGRGEHKIAAPIGSPPVFYQAGSAYRETFEEIAALGT